MIFCLQPAIRRLCRYNVLRIFLRQIRVLSQTNRTIVLCLPLSSFRMCRTNQTCPETITRTYRVTDACDNSITVSQLITVMDDIPPTASDPAPVAVQCISDVPAPNPIVVIDEMDNCSTPTVAFVSDVSDNQTCSETITRTYSVTDDCGNFILVTQQIIISDETPPVLITELEPAISVSCEDIPVIPHSRI